MRKLTNLLAITLLGSCATAFAQSNDEPTAAEKSAETYAGGYDKFRFGGYGEILANFMDYGINRFYGGGIMEMQKQTETQSPSLVSL